MFEDSNEFGKDVTGQVTADTTTKPTGSTVDLFPALADRKMMPINSIRQPVTAKPGTQFSVFEPISFDEALDIVECLRARAATTITLDKMKRWTLRDWLTLSPVHQPLCQAIFIN